MELKQPKSIVLRLCQYLLKYVFTKDECSITWIQIVVSSVGLTCGTIGGEMGKENLFCQNKDPSMVYTLHPMNQCKHNFDNTNIVC
jgi:hypothetical protein